MSLNIDKTPITISLFFCIFGISWKIYWLCKKEKSKRKTAKLRSNIALIEEVKSKLLEKWDFWNNDMSNVYNLSALLEYKVSRAIININYFNLNSPLQVMKCCFSLWWKILAQFENVDVLFDNISNFWFWRFQPVTIRKEKNLDIKGSVLAKLVKRACEKQLNRSIIS